MCNESFRSLDFRPDPRYDNGMTEETALSFAYAVQPRAWENFDAAGADYVTDLDLAKAVATLWGEPCTIWACPSNRPAYALQWA